ncbi:MAG: hypothetical protein K940chlam9_00138 [Chlamydiae bacterium]|nr:hypothetical protein [Chlamydiota bacterium]
MNSLPKVDGGYLLKVKVIPNARQTQVVGWENDHLKVKVTAPPEKGEANRAVIALAPHGAPTFHSPLAGRSFTRG